MLFSHASPPDMFESEPNDTAATANAVTVSASPTVVAGALGGSDFHDWFTFTLSQRSGVFLDVDALEVGLSANLDTIVEIYDAAGTTKLAENDDGRDFDPLSVPAPDLGAPLPGRPVGGLGIPLVRRLMDEMRHERRRGRNLLTLTKRSVREA